jgi:beta-lactam-binding protein with PASTA domain
VERAPTTTVPDVTGLTQAQAEAAIVAAGLYTGAPDNVTSTAPPGTVLAQNSPGGTVEPVGSQVQITVSYGQTTVPDVVGDPAAEAEYAIKNAGLTFTTSTIINCVDQRALGTVQSQNPAGGAQVSPGASVNIQITACNR